MKQFKRFFYISYLVFFAIAAFVAVYRDELVLKWDWDFITGWVGLLKFVLKLGGVGVVLFIIELIIENIHINSLKRKISTLETEKLELKAKLYDKAESESVETALPEVEASPASDEEKESESNN